MNISYTGILAGSVAYGVGLLAYDVYKENSEYDETVWRSLRGVLKSEGGLEDVSMPAILVALGGYLTKFAIDTVGMDPFFLAGSALAGVAGLYFTHSVVTDNLKEKDYIEAAMASPCIVGLNAAVASLGGLLAYGAAEGAKTLIAR